MVSSRTCCVHHAGNLAIKSILLATAFLTMLAAGEALLECGDLSRRSPTGSFVGIPAALPKLRQRERSLCMHPGWVARVGSLAKPANAAKIASALLAGYLGLLKTAPLGTKVHCPPSPPHRYQPSPHIYRVSALLSRG
jgi:hypothetical protein